MKRLLVLLPFVLFALLALGFWYGLGRTNSNLPSVLTGKPVPVFSIKGLVDRQLLTDAKITSTGKVTLVNFFASWCVPCRAEHAVLVDLAKRDDLTLVGIAYKNKKKDALRFLELLGNPYDLTGMDLNGRASIDWGLYGVPETYIISRDGLIIDRIDEPLINPTGMERLEKALARVGVAL